MKRMYKINVFVLLILTLLLTACFSTPVDVLKAIPPGNEEVTYQETNSTENISTSPQDNQTDPIRLSDLPTTNEIVVYFLDVGQAAAAFIICDGRTMLIDGGGASSSNLIYSFLDRNGIDHLDYIVNTHPHEDHVGGLSGALNKVSSIGTVFGSALEYNTRAFDSFLKYLDEHDINIIIPKAGDSFMLGTALVEVLAPLRDYNDENNNSLVLKMTYGDISFLFKGDAERASEIDMVEAGLDLSATVLKVSHHGSNTSTTYPFLREVMPEIAIISVGVNNQHKHPHDDTLSRLRDADVKVYRTDLQGDIIIRSDGKNLTVETQRNLDIPTNPTDVSNLHTDSTDTYIDEITHTHIGNARTKKFHTLICHTLPEEHNRVHLESRDHAINDGFDPCGNCKP